MITLEILPQATAQQIFDQVATHLLTQRQKSTRKDGRCMYKSESLKCAAGCLIADDEYNPKFESESWSTLIYKGLVSGNHGNLIMQLQRLHDGEYPEDWKENLILLGNDFKLDTSKIETLNHA